MGRTNLDCHQGDSRLQISIIESVLHTCEAWIAFTNVVISVIEADVLARVRLTDGHLQHSHPDEEAL